MKTVEIRRLIQERVDRDTTRSRSMKAVTAIKAYFEADPHGRKVTMDELKALDKDDRQELGALACVELGEEFEPTPVT